MKDKMDGNNARSFAINVSLIHTQGDSYRPQALSLPLPTHMTRALVAKCTTPIPPGTLSGIISSNDHDMCMCVCGFNLLYRVVVARDTYTREG